MKAVKCKVIETERLVLRLFTESDANSMYENWATDEDAVKENEIKPIYLETTCDPKSHFNPDQPNRYKWQESINRIVWRISKKPELLLDFVQDADTDYVMAACCVKELFLLNSDKCENIADIQDKAVSSYLEHIPLFLQKTEVSDRNEGFYKSSRRCPNGIPPTAFTPPVCGSFLVLLSIQKNDTIYLPLRRCCSRS